MKRFVARKVYRLITDPPDTPNGTDLRSRREAAGASLAVTAIALSSRQTRISQLERGLVHDNGLPLRYQTWLESSICSQ